MRKQLIYLVITFLTMSNVSVIAQHHFNIRLSPSTTSTTEQVCYDVQLASTDGVDFNLAGQNYRLYYDATELKYDKNRSSILLPEDKYTHLIVKDNLQDIDAGGAGLLNFDNHLSFLNLGNDLKDEQDGGVLLPASGEWVSTANICFDLIDKENIAFSNNKHSIFWARPDLTKSYASAYVEVAEWVAPFTTIAAKAAVYFDQELNTSTSGEALENRIKVYPNPTKDKIFIDFSENEVLKIQLYSVSGQLVLEENFSTNNASPAVDLSALASGVYHLRLISDEKQMVKKIEKIH